MGEPSIAVLVSGTGSNLKSIAQAIDAGACRADIGAVIADRHCDALAWAEARGVPTRVVRSKAYPDRASWDAALAETIASFDPSLVVLAGFMKIVGEHVLRAFHGRIVNVHPALLPAFPGMHAPRQALEAHAARAGCTVHLVDAGVDTGPMLAQAACPILDGDDEGRLHARIQTLEHALLPAVIDSLLARCATS